LEAGKRYLLLVNGSPNATVLNARATSDRKRFIVWGVLESLEATNGPLRTFMEEISCPPCDDQEGLIELQTTIWTTFAMECLDEDR
jgi:hypothetical protein